MIVLIVLRILAIGLCVVNAIFMGIESNRVSACLGWVLSALLLLTVYLMQG